MFTFYSFSQLWQFTKPIKIIWNTAALTLLLASSATAVSKKALMKDMEGLHQGQMKLIKKKMKTVRKLTGTELWRTNPELSTIRATPTVLAATSPMGRMAMTVLTYESDDCTGGVADTGAGLRRDLW